MVLQNYQYLIEMTSNMIYIVAFGGGFKCPRKIHLNTHCPPRTNSLLHVYQYVSCKNYKLFFKTFLLQSGPLQSPTYLFEFILAIWLLAGTVVCILVRMKSFPRF